MASMLELIRDRKAPSSIVRRAARGELSVSPREAVAILSTLMSDGELRSEAERTLRSFEESSLCEVACDPATAPEVLRCLLRTQRDRPAVIEALCENAALPLEELEAVAGEGASATLEAMMRSARVRSSTRLLRLMKANPASQMRRAQPVAAESVLELEMVQATAEPEQKAESIYAAGDMQELLLRYSDGHPVPADEERPFELVTGPDDEADPVAELLERAKLEETEDIPEETPEQNEHLSILQQIARMKVGDRIKLAMRGSREERMILIRDRSKLVAMAVLASPKVNDSEMESFAAMKNIQEAVLRAIAGNRKNMKSYGVIRALANNPKTPLDVALPLLLHLLLKDLRAVGVSKNVNETVRKRAARLYRLKTESKKES